MTDTKQDLFTASKIAEELGVSANIVKKTIKILNMQPDEKKGVCNYYYRNNLQKIKEQLKK